MKKQIRFLLALIVMLGIAFPIQAQAAVVKLTMVKGEEMQLPDAYWYSRYTSSDEKIVDVSSDGVVKAKHMGTATVMQTTLNDPIQYQIKVTDTVDIVVAMGQSNMCGSGGSTYYSPEVSGSVLQYQNNSLFQMKRQGTLLPAFGNAYVKKAKRPVIIIQTAVSGSSSIAWLRDGLITNSVAQLKKCKAFLKRHQVKVKHIYMLWYNGETDGKKGLSQLEYNNNLNAIYKKMAKAGTEKFLMIQVGQYRDRRYDMSVIIEAQKYICKKNKKFVMVSNATKTLSGDAKWYSDNVHFNQLALNKIGEQAGKNAGKLARK